MVRRAETTFRMGWQEGSPGGLGIGPGAILKITDRQGQEHLVEVGVSKGQLTATVGNNTHVLDGGFPKRFGRVEIVAQSPAGVDLPEPDHRYQVNTTREATRASTELELLQQSPACALGKKIAAYCKNGPHHVSLHPSDSAVQLEIFGLDRDDLSEQYKDWFENDYFQYIPNLSEFKWVGSSEDLCAFTFGLLRGLGEWKTEWLEAMQTVDSMQVAPLIILNGSKADADIWIQFARP